MLGPRLCQEIAKLDAHNPMHCAFGARLYTDGYAEKSQGHHGGIGHSGVVCGAVRRRGGSRHRGVAR
ncbi:hypothetical protein G6F68_021169 [Rhizopus microsporus]|nr:hypothetical protein G6F31_021348 [Rhizopus arrhizus]KAG1220554.1 hypothetical protein G6F68_021169 [Rhizopus microsporus]